MCSYSADHAGKIAEAEAGQRLVIRKVHGISWAVQESELEAPRPTPVCLVDGTKVLFRSGDGQPEKVPAIPEAEAVFRVLRRPKRDVFEFSDARQVGVDSLPTNLVFDVLEIPGKEELSSMLKEEAHEYPEISLSAGKSESLLERLLALF
jgi:hypothetical protein